MAADGVRKAVFSAQRNGLIFFSAELSGGGRELRWLGSWFCFANQQDCRLL
jgi:hypothetical protein